MLADEVESLVRTLREHRTDNSEVEAKAAKTELPKSVRETLSAFANTSGGVLILGVAESEEFKVEGVSDPAKIASDLASVCATDLEPPLRPTIGQVALGGGTVVVAEIAELDLTQKPCYVKARGMSKGSFIRVHDGDQALTSYEVQMLLSNRKQPAFDAEVVQDATVESDLDQDSVDAYVSRVRELRSTAVRGLTVAQILTQHRLAQDDNGVARPTIAGLLALGRYPQRHFPQLMVTLVVYPTESGPDLSSGARFLDNVTIEGSIPSMAREALVAIKRNMRRRSTVSGVGRTDIWEYPEAALREAIVNALVHRDLSPESRGTQVQIEMYPDRLSIRNPGGLYGPVSIAELTTSGTSSATGTSSARNAFLLKALEDVQLPDEDRTICENRGSGIRTMVEALRAAGMSPPRFADRISTFSLTFPNHALLDDETVEWIRSLNEPGLSDAQCIGLALLRVGDVLDNARYRAATGVDSRVATNDLQDLVVRELVTQIGSRRWTEYRLAPRALPEGPDSARRLSPRDRRPMIIDAMRGGDLSRVEIERRTGLGRKVVVRWLGILKREGLLRTVGDAAPTSPNVRYELTPKAVGQDTIDFGIDVP